MHTSEPDNKRSHRKRNPVVLELLQEKGCDLDQSHTIVNVMYANNLATAMSLVELLRDNGFQVLEDMSDLMEDRVLERCIKAQIDMLPSLTNLNEMTDKCVDLARQANAEYDGWYTEV